MLLTVKKEILCFNNVQNMHYIQMLLFYEKKYERNKQKLKVLKTNIYNLLINVSSYHKDDCCT